MIFPFLLPYLKGFVGFSKAPITWCIILVTCGLHMTTSDGIDKVHSSMKDIIKNKEFLKAQGKVYSAFIDRYPEFYSKSILSVNESVKEGDGESLEYLAALSMNDGRFLMTAKNTFSMADRVSYEWWRQGINKFMDIRDKHPRYMLGVSALRPEMKSWVTYQFAHSGWMHLLTNMFFLLIFGAFIERAFGSFVLVGVYLFSGFIGAGAFLLASDFSASPLLGASASVTGVIAFLCATLWKRTIDYVYILMVPVHGYIGIVKLPAWIAYVLWLIKDLTGFLSEDPLTGQDIAFSAHIGGFFCGTLLALSYVYLKRKKPTVNPAVGTQPTIN